MERRVPAQGTAKGDGNCLTPVLAEVPIHRNNYIVHTLVVMNHSKTKRLDASNLLRKDRKGRMGYNYLEEH